MNKVIPAAQVPDINKKQKLPNKCIVIFLKINTFAASKEYLKPSL
jgi:hypothetical protein